MLNENIESNRFVHSLMLFGNVFVMGIMRNILHHFQSDLDNVQSSRNAYVGFDVVFDAPDMNFKHKLYRSMMNGEYEMKVVHRMFINENVQKVKRNVAIVCSLFQSVSIKMSMF